MRRIVWMLCLCLTAASYAATPAKHTSARRASAPTVEMLVNGDWLAAHLRDKDLVLVQVSSQRNVYDAGHIPGARFLPISAIAVTRDGVPNELPTAAELRKVFESLGVSNRSRIVLYGDEAGVFAARAWFTLDYLGLSARASLLDGGMELWSQTRQLERTPAVATAPGHIIAAPQPAKLALLPEVRQAANSHATLIIDARSREMFDRGHIPGAVDLFWGDMIASRQSPTLAPLSTMRQRFAAAGVRTGARVIVYCNTGMQASYDYFMLRLAGYKPALYDASYYEWSRSAR